MAGGSKKRNPLCPLQPNGLLNRGNKKTLQSQRLKESSTDEGGLASQMRTMMEGEKHSLVSLPRSLDLPRRGGCNTCLVTVIGRVLLPLFSSFDV
eukprot:scaffold5662_cov57-Attheya_sp.AAC.1